MPTLCTEDTDARLPEKEELCISELCLELTEGERLRGLVSAAYGCRGTDMRRFWSLGDDGGEDGGGYGGLMRWKLVRRDHLRDFGSSGEVGD